MRFFTYITFTFTSRLVGYNRNILDNTFNNFQFYTEEKVVTNKKQ